MCLKFENWVLFKLGFSVNTDGEDPALGEDGESARDGVVVRRGYRAHI